VTERKLEKIVELDASPEQVWEAIASGPGITGWFVPTRMERRADGAITQDFGGGAGVTGKIHAWEPGRRRVAGAAEAPPEGSANYAFEFLVEGRAGSGTVLRFVQSGFVDTEGWENEYNSLDKGWDLFFDNLRAYLAHFAGQPARGVVTMVFTPVMSQAEAWAALQKALGLAGRPAVGDQVTLDGPQQVSGVVDVASAEFLGIRSENALFRFGAEGDMGCGLSAYHYFYGDPVDTEKLTAAWQGWLNELVPAGS
jgi:uncharacterized protein YndB with AHSA1/START domain